MVKWREKRQNARWVVEYLRLLTIACIVTLITISGWALRSYGEGERRAS